MVADMGRSTIGVKAIVITMKLKTVNSESMKGYPRYFHSAGTSSKICVSTYVLTRGVMKATTRLGDPFMSIMLVVHVVKISSSEPEMIFFTLIQAVISSSTPEMLFLALIQAVSWIFIKQIGTLGID